MATESDENLNSEPTATPELVSSAIESAKSQGLDINPYSVALEAGIAAQTLFTNTELMNLVIAARGDQTTFSIDSHLLERCQELEAEMAKLLDVNQEIYDRALEMEERVIQLEAKVSEMEEDTEHLTMQLQNSWHLGYKKGLNDGQSQEVKASQKPMIDIELPKEEVKQEASTSDTGPIKAVIDIELPREEEQAPSLLDIELPEAVKVPSSSLLDIELPEAQKLSSKSLLDIELPEAEKLAANSHIEAEQVKEQPSIKSLIDIELPKEEKQSIKSLIDFELPKEETPSQTDFSTAKSGEAASGAAPPAGTAQEGGATPSFNDRVFNAVSDSVTASSAVESYGSMSWREVETIYQYSATGGASASSPNMVFEPLAPGQTVGARSGDAADSAANAQTAESSGGQANVPVGDGDISAPFSRGDTQPMRSDTQPIIVSQPGTGENALPPILKADAPAPKAEGASAAAAGSAAKTNPRSTFTGLSSKSLQDPDPPLERTMSQYLGDSSAYLNLDRVSMAPENEDLLSPLAEASNKAAAQSAAAAAEAAAPPAEAGAAGQTPSLAASQAETQTLVGASQALKAEARAKAEASAEIASSHPFNPAASHSAEITSQSNSQTKIRATTGPGEPRWAKREADVTFDGLTAMENDSTTDVLDLDKLDIFEGMEDIDELNQIEVIEDVVLPGTTQPTEAQKKSKYKSSEHIPVVSSDDLHDLIKSRIKKAGDTHEPPRFDSLKSPAGAERSTVSGTSNPVAAPGAGADASQDAAGASGADYSGAVPGTASSAKNEAVSPPPVPSIKELDALRQGARNKFVGGKAAASPLSPPGSTSNPDSPIGASASNASMLLSTRGVPPEIRKACMILGVRPEDLTLKEVNEKWKAQLTAPGVHPDQGGDTESAIYLNTAKDTLVKWINDQNSKMGKKFGKKDGPDHPPKRDEPPHPPQK